MEENNDRNLARKVLGSVTLKTGFYLPTFTEITAPFRKDLSVARISCNNCGLLTEIDQQKLNECLSITGSVELKKGSYFEINGCPICGKDTTTLTYREVYSH
jgi:transcription elongation factor Elf1